MIEAIATLTITDLLGSIDLTVSSPEALNRRPAGLISLGPVGSQSRTAQPSRMPPIRRRGALQNPANWINLKAASMLINNRPRYFRRRSSPACAKKALASVKISLARLSSRTSRSSALTLGGSGFLISTRLAFCLGDPVLQRLGHAADLLGYRLNGSPLRLMMFTLLVDNADHTLSKPRGRLCLSAHGSIFSKIGTFAKPGAIQ
jgi:hypothetical protein